MKIKPCQVYRIRDVFILEVNKIVNKRFKSLCHVKPDLDILFVKVTAQIEDRLH